MVILTIFLEKRKIYHFINIQVRYRINVSSHPCVITASIFFVQTNSIRCAYFFFVPYIQIKVIGLKTFSYFGVLIYP